VTGNRSGIGKEVVISTPDGHRGGEIYSKRLNRDLSSSRFALRGLSHKAIFVSELSSASIENWMNFELNNFNVRQRPEGRDDGVLSVILERLQ
jgi:hypothetical protein